MSSQLAYATTILVVIFIVAFRYLRSTEKLPDFKEAYQVDLKNPPQESTKLSKILASAIPDSVILAQDAPAFKQSLNSYWAQQECEVIPACIVRPINVQQLCTAIEILRLENGRRESPADGGITGGLFAIRSGGHSPVPGAASIKGGILIDLSLFCEVTPSEDGSYVVVGAGARWKDVYKTLDEQGLAVVGGRNSAVGVGGLTLGGGLSFFSPRFGLVCSNIINFDVVLASGSSVTASASTNPDLWRALKGGSNNFGIVTSFKMHSFPCSKIWSGFLYMPAIQATNVLTAFHEYVSRSDEGDRSAMYDDQAAGPIACFSYIQQLGFQAIAVNLVHTKPPENEKRWPTCWKTSSFSSLWRLWSTCKIRTLTSATDEMNALNPPGRRQVFATTTIKSDLATLREVHAAYYHAIASLRPINVKGLVWTLVLQPLLPDWVRKGDPNALGLLENTHTPLVIVSFTVNWDERRNDEIIKKTMRRTVEQIEAVARANGTDHPFRYLNYCADWQKPFEGYGKDNWRFLREVSRKYDPEGLFQTGCMGGFKLGVSNDEV